MKNSDMPAMPTQVNGGDIYGGLTKREYFAGLAMQGFLSADVNSDWHKDDCVKIAVQHADALLAELERAK